MEHRADTVSRGRAAGSGLIAAWCLVAVAEPLALAFSAASAPFVAVGEAFIDLIPPGLKDVVVDLFGTYDKPVLFGAMALVYSAAALGIGLLGRRSRALAGSLLAVLGLGAALAVLSRSPTTVLDVVPTAVGTAIGVGVLILLLRLAVDVPPGEAEDDGLVIDARRRRFLVAAVTTGALAVAVGVLGRAAAGARAAAEAARTLFAVPAPVVPAPPIPAAAQVDLAGMPPFLTPAADFYRIDTALAVPRIDARTWSLRVTGLVEHELQIGIDELLAEPMTEAHVTLTCVSNPVGGDLAGNATWTGVPVRTLLERAGVRAGADMVLSRSVDGFTASTPLEALTDERAALLAVGMNGRPLPLEHGYPVRMVVPGLYGYVSATKWLEELRVTRFADETAYWTDRGWSERGPIKIASRIDVPRPSARVGAGTVELGGTAWAQQRGIARVEVRIDDGPWQDAQLGASAGDDCWRQWSFTWEGARSGEHRATVRATGGDGEEQTPDRADPVPDGASGWHSITFRVA